MMSHVLFKQQQTNIWHDQGKWVTCQKCQFQFSHTTFSKLQNASLWCKPHYNWTSSYRVNEWFGDAKNIMKQRKLNTVFANISKSTTPTSDSFLLIMSHIWTNVLQTKTELMWWHKYQHLQSNQFVNQVIIVAGILLRHSIAYHA